MVRWLRSGAAPATGRSRRAFSDDRGDGGRRCFIACAERAATAVRALAAARRRRGARGPAATLHAARAQPGEALRSLLGAVRGSAAGRRAGTAEGAGPL